MKSLLQNEWERLKSPKSIREFNIDFGYDNDRELLPALFDILNLEPLPAVTLAGFEVKGYIAGVPTLTPGLECLLNRLLQTFTLKKLVLLSTYIPGPQYWQLIDCISLSHLEFMTA